MPVLSILGDCSDQGYRNYQSMQVLRVQTVMGPKVLADVHIAIMMLLIRDTVNLKNQLPNK